MAVNRAKFVLGDILPVEETRSTELKEITGSNPIRSITNTADEYAVAFLNSEGGRIFWGIRDADHSVVGVAVPQNLRDRLRKDVMAKLHSIQPEIDPTRFRLEIHALGGADRAGDLAVVELIVPKGDLTVPYFTGGHDVFVRVDGVKKKLSGPQLTDWIKSRLANSTSVLGSVDDRQLIALVERIRRVFAAHGLEPSHLSRFLKQCEAPFAIELKDTQTDSALLAWLDEAKIEWISRTFLIRREWIDGEDERIHDEPYFDKQPKKFFTTISKHVEALIFKDLPASPEAYFIRWGKGKEWEKKGESRVFVVVAVPLARFSNERIIFKYISDHQAYPWNYERTNIQLRAWARLLFVYKNVVCHGCEIPFSLGEAVESNTIFLHDVIEGERGLRRIDWHPEDYGMYSSESRVAKDTETLEDVLAFLRSHGLRWEETKRAK